MNLSTTMMLAILDGHGEPQERQEMRRLMQAAGVDAPLQRWRAVGGRLELTLLNGKVIYLPPGGAVDLQETPPTLQAGGAGEVSQPDHAAEKAATRRKGAGKPRPGEAHGLHP